MEKNVILFDMDGVLIDSEPLHFREWQQVFREIYRMEIDFERYKVIIGSTLETFKNKIYEIYGIDISDRADVWQRQKEVKKEMEEREGIPPVPGAVALVKALKEHGYRMAVASSSPYEYVETVIKDLDLFDYFEVLISGENVPNPKPAPDTFLEAAKLMHAAPEQCIVVEDSHNGVLAAKNAGMFCIGLKNPNSGDQDISSADEIVFSLDEIGEILSVKE